MGFLKIEPEVLCLLGAWVAWTNSFVRAFSLIQRMIEPAKTMAFRN
ncbi:MAG TPA: hypothetical protein ACFYD6_09050 [Candidatus Brocadiia bacterium]|nr:hypothetical protein [Planctomycetota bacterium]MDO8093588.1 hypothetical protein [Candidatus Brocadiales bacterium]